MICERRKIKYFCVEMRKNSNFVFSFLLRTFDAERLRDYWYETGTPTFLVKMLKKINFDVKSMEKDIKFPANSIFEYRVENSNPIPLLYQSGYLTIKDYIEQGNSYILGFPNEEVNMDFYMNCCLFICLKQIF